MADRTHGRDRLVARRTVSQWFGIASAVLALVTVVIAVVGGLAIAHLTTARDLVVNRLGPARTASVMLTAALLDQENAVHDYVLTGRLSSLTRYDSGQQEEQTAFATLDRLTRGAAEAEPARAEIAIAMARTATWRNRYATPTIAAVRSRGAGAHGPLSTDAGRFLFDAIRVPLMRQQALLNTARDSGRLQLDDAANQLTATFAVIIALLVVVITGVMVALRRTVSRPLRRVGRQVRRAAQGTYEEPITGSGPRDIVELASDVDAMRQEIVSELSSIQEAHVQLDEQAQELQRSNAELEQFAYVASHDLQEPLRKVASFCQLIEKRYAGQLDERGEQYIAFAVDGAKRMQQLINDLLAFSRVGRVPGDRVVVDCDEVVRQAVASLAAAIEETGATVVVGPLPRVRGEATLLAAVFQNLIGNALKFHGETPPQISVTAARDGAFWSFACADDGIGIEPEYAERIFLIFQRLHPKDVYGGTGIGLAMCRKIIEYHGGRIWLDTEPGAGTTFRFTLPAIEEDA